MTFQVTQNKAKILYRTQPCLICFPLHLWPCCESSPMHLLYSNHWASSRIWDIPVRLLPQRLAFPYPSERQDLRASPWLANSLSYGLSLFKSHRGSPRPFRLKPQLHLHPMVHLQPCMVHFVFLAIIID